jgi:CRP-like cAMP-binding protein
MPVDIDSKDGKEIRKLIPLATLPAPVFAAICSVIEIEEAKQDYVLFRKGDQTNEFIYLLSGKITLQFDELKVDTISADDTTARFAIAHQNPRKIDAIANCDIRFLRIDMEIINNPPTVFTEEEQSYMVTENTEENADDWMTTLLKSPIFQRLPASNLHQILIGLKEIKYNSGDTIIKQGEPGDYYYLIRQGHCLVTRKPSPNAKEIKLAELHANETFGEDSLLSGEPRNVTITALNNVSLLRLDKQQFINLIKNPVLGFIDFSSIQQELDNGAMLLDVRSPDVYKKMHLDNSINTPFFSLRMQIKSLNRKKKAIVVCDDGNISEAAAFLLIKSKFHAVILKGGIQQVPQEVFSDTATFDIKDGIESVIDATAPKEGAAPSKTTTTVDTVPKEISLEAQISQLKSENESLKVMTAQLKKQCAKLLQEKTQAEKKIRLLLDQNQKLNSQLKKTQPVNQE